MAYLVYTLIGQQPVRIFELVLKHQGIVPFARYDNNNNRLENNGKAVGKLLIGYMLTKIYSTYMAIMVYVLFIYRSMTEIISTVNWFYNGIVGL